MSRQVEAEELRGVDLEARIQIATKVGKLLAREDKKDHESALELAKLIVDDVSVSVRQALANELRHCNFLPKAIVETLCRDIDQISMPFLVSAEAVDDEFLEMIVRECGPGKQEAIAQRAGLSEAVSYAICDVGVVEAVKALLENDTAEMAERGFQRIVDRFPVETSLMEKLAARADLPIAVAERIIFKVSAAYSEFLTTKFELSSDYASYLLSLATRQVFSRALDVAPMWEVNNYLSQLNNASGLTPDILLSYLQNKNVRLFLAAIAVLLDRDFEVVEQRIGRYNRAAFARILERLGVANSVAGVLLIAYDRLFKG